MLHPDFDEIYLHLRKRGVMVTVMSNGWRASGRLAA